MRILRPIGTARQTTYEVFSNAFDSALQSFAHVERTSVEAWALSFTGMEASRDGLKQAATGFEKLHRDFDYFCPSPDASHLIVAAIALRNYSKLSLRLMAIVHSPAAVAFDLTMLAPMLVSGDVLIATSTISAKLLILIAPDLGPFIHVVQHAILPAPCTAKIQPQSDIVFLSRQIPDKGLHILIEAVSKLISEGVELKRVSIIGSPPLSDQEANEYSSYVKRRVADLDLNDKVIFWGEVDEETKWGILKNSKVCCVLSTSIYESFGKAVAEGIVAGCTMVVSNWNGFPETLNGTGVLVRTQKGELPGQVTVSLKDLKKSLLKAMTNTKKVAQNPVARFSVQEAASKYSSILSRPSLSIAAPLNPFKKTIKNPAFKGLSKFTHPTTSLDWKSLMDIYIDSIIFFSSSNHQYSLALNDARELFCRSVAPTVTDLFCNPSKQHDIEKMQPIVLSCCPELHGLVDPLTSVCLSKAAFAWSHLALIRHAHHSGASDLIAQSLLFLLESLPSGIRGVDYYISHYRLKKCASPPGFGDIPSRITYTTA